jgi:DNA-binding SARP family transcriptional activator/tetratricopeptide (TPR) repeat protein
MQRGADHGGFVMAVEFRLLGPVEAGIDGELLDLGPARQQCVLAALLVEVNQVVTVDQLLYRVWGDGPPYRARGTLYSYLSRLRKILAGVENAGIVRRSGGYAFKADPAAVDLHRFHELIARARDDDDGQASALLAEALGLWRGESFAGLDTPWINTARDAAEAERVTAELDHTDLRLSQGGHGALLPDLTARAAARPLDERVAGQLMLALYRCGRQADALAAYERIRRRLADELGVEPGPDLRAAHVRILRQQVPAPPASAGSPIRLPAPASLPADVPDFAGRDDDLRRMDDLHAHGAKVVVLCGSAGVGKTALATRWAHRARECFPHGQLYLNLHGYSATPPLRPVDALSRLLRDLGIPAERIPTDLDEATGLYRSLLADRRVLVVLDNAHHPDQVRPLIPADVGSLAVITSRNRLTGLVAKDGARRLDVDVLSSDEAVELLTRTVSGHRVQAEPAAATDLAEMCSHLPLALRITAARLSEDPYRSLAEHVSELGGTDRLSALHIPGDTEASVSGAFDLSYAALDSETRRVFRLLGLVPGPDFSVGAAAALAGCPPAHAGDMLGRLAAVCLVERHGSGRYAFHDLLRDYARTRAAEDDERESATDRLYNWYLRAATAASVTLYTDAATVLLEPPPARADGDRAAALAFLDTERHNLVTAIQHAAEYGPRPMAWLLTDVLRTYLFFGFHVGDGLTAGHCAASAAAEAGEPAALAVAELTLARAYQGMGDNDTAVRHMDTALSLCRTAGLARVETYILNGAGMLAYTRGRLAEAERHYRDAIDLSAESAPVHDTTVVRFNLGHVYLGAGRIRQALAQFTAVLPNMRRDPLGEALTLSALGRAHCALGDPDLAAARLTEALTKLREIGSRYGEVQAMVDLADALHQSGRHGEAHDMASRALALAQDIGDSAYQVAALAALGAASHGLGDIPAAVRNYRRAIDQSSETAHPLHHVAARIGMARVLLDLSRTAEARSHAELSLTISRGHGYRHMAQRASAIITATDTEADRVVQPTLD